MPDSPVPGRRATLPFILIVVFIDVLGIGLAMPVLPMLVGDYAPSRDLQSYWYGVLVIVYGLMAFVVYRLSPRRWVRLAAVLAALTLVVVMAFDRLYLELHWESDVIGALLLGTVCLLTAMLWLDRPAPA